MRAYRKEPQRTTKLMFRTARRGTGQSRQMQPQQRQKYWKALWLVQKQNHLRIWYESARNIRTLAICNEVRRLPNSATQVAKLSKKNVVHITRRYCCVLTLARDSNPIHCLVPRIGYLLLLFVIFFHFSIFFDQKEVSLFVQAKQRRLHRRQKPRWRMQILRKAISRNCSEKQNTYVDHGIVDCCAFFPKKKCHISGSDEL